MVDLTAKIVKLENDIEDFKRRERELPAEEREQRLAFLGVVKESTELLNTLISQQGISIICRRAGGRYPFFLLKSFSDTSAYHCVFSS